MSKGALGAKFATLAAQRLERLQNLVVRLEQGVDRSGDGREAQRELHTLKGEARILGFDRTARIAHAVEELLHASLAGEELSSDAVRRLLLGLDRLGELVAGIAREGEPDVDVEAAIRQIGPAAGDAGTSAPVADATAPREAANAPATAEIALDSAHLDELTRLLGEMRALHARFRATAGALRAIDERLTGQGRSSVGTVVQEVHRLARDAYAAARTNVFENASLLERMDYLTWSLRVLPVDPHLARHPRATRDLAVSLGKRVRLDIEEHGARVERPVLEALDEIVVHLLRNAVDHGVELPAERAAAGKPDAGRIAIAVRPRGAHIELTVDDDGCGIDPEALRRSAVVNRFLSPEAAAVASDDDVMELLFAPGFTTRREVSEVSGRGVGLDAVRDRARSIGGTVTVRSTPGRGATFKVILPARATMTRALIVSVAGASLALPAQSIRAVLGLTRSEIETAAGSLFVRVDGEPLPLLDLARSLGEPSEGVLSDPLTAILVVQDGARRVFVVDRALGGCEAVQVPPGRLLEGHACLRSIALLDDGEMALSIDTSALPAVRISASRLTAPAGAAPLPSAAPRVSVLVVDDSEVTRDVISATLRDAGFDVTEAVDGRQALERIAAARPSLVITDLQMPVMDGFALMRALRASAAWKDLPLIVVSTLGSEADRNQASRAGADAYVVKSQLRRDVLLEVVSRFARIAAGPA